MLKRQLIAFIAISLTSLPSLAQERPNKEERAAMAMDAIQIAALAETQGLVDQLEPSVWVSTQPFLKSKAGNDTFLRAHIDKATGSVVYQIYMSGIFAQSMRFTRMTYLVEGNLRSAKASRVYYDVSCQRYGCSHFEDYVIEVPRADLEALAAAGGAAPSWPVRLFGQSVTGFDAHMLNNETAGFLLAVDQVLGAMQRDKERAKTRPLP